jgi:hypothetical protein
VNEAPGANARGLTRSSEKGDHPSGISRLTGMADVEEFIQRLVAAAPTLSEEQVESIRRVVAGAPPDDRGSELLQLDSNQQPFD